MLSSQILPKSSDQNSEVLGTKYKPNVEGLNKLFGAHISAAVLL